MANAEKRSVSTDALETLGTIIGTGEKRDAIHLAVEPVTAMENLLPGQDVGFVPGGVGRSNKPVGIVDPFLSGQVKRGQRFWLVVYPRQITSLRHVWSHPAFAEEPEVSHANQIKIDEVADVLDGRLTSKQFLEAFAQEIGFPLVDLLDHAEAYQVNEEYWNEGSAFVGTQLPNEFWEHWSKYTGKQVVHTDDFFACSC